MELLENERIAIEDIKVLISRGNTRIDLRPLYFACNQNKEHTANIIKAHIKEPVWFESFNGGMRIDYYIRLDKFDIQRYYILSRPDKELSEPFYPQPYQYYDWSETIESAEWEFNAYDRRVLHEKSKPVIKLPWYKRFICWFKN
jgi:hypothetical protein